MIIPADTFSHFCKTIRENTWDACVSAFQIGRIAKEVFREKSPLLTITPVLIPITLQAFPIDSDSFFLPLCGTIGAIWGAYITKGDPLAAFISGYSAIGAEHTFLPLIYGNFVPLGIDFLLNRG